MSVAGSFHNVFKRIVITGLCIVSLSGCARFLAGGTGTMPVGTESGVRSLGQVFIDSSIERTANINLYKLDPRFKQSRVNLISFHSNVLLTGQVPDPYLKQLAEDNVRAMSDVKAVHNYISVGPKVSYTTIMQDAAVTANTKGLVMKAPVVSASKIKLHTEDGVLYVLGRLNTAEINDLTTVLQQVGDVSKIVTLIDNTDTELSTQLALPSSAFTTALVADSNAVVSTPVAIDSDATSTMPVSPLVASNTIIVRAEPSATANNLNGINANQNNDNVTNANVVTNGNGTRAVSTDSNTSAFVDTNTPATSSSTTVSATDGSNAAPTVRVLPE